MLDGADWRGIDHKAALERQPITIQESSGRNISISAHPRGHTRGIAETQGDNFEADSL